MTTNIGLVDSTELRHIFESLMMFRSEGVNVPGITVYCEGGRRKWLVTTKEFTIVVTGDAADFAGAYKLPLTIVANAGRPRAAAGAVAFTVCDGLVTATSSYGTQTLPCSTTAMPTIRRATAGHNRATAQLGGKELLYTIFSGANPPFETNMTDDEDDERTNPDHFLLRIADGRLHVSSDWSGARLYEMRAHTTAHTTGAGQIKVDPDMLNIIYNCVDEDATWTLSFDGNESLDIVLESDTHYIVSSMVIVSAAKLHERVVKILEREKFEHHAPAGGPIGVRHDGVVISLDLFQRDGSDASLVRLSTVVTRNANESSELLREINAHNQNGLITRLWFDRGSVHLAIDVLPDNLVGLAQRIRMLATEAGRLRGVLDPFAAESSMPPTPRARRRQTKPKVQPEVWD
ncbi:MAG: hypothetical protein ACO3VO_03565 [Ilumatobacteraceae bacterium]